MLIPDSGGGGAAAKSTTVAGVDVTTGMSIVNAALSGAIEIILDAAEVAKVNGHLDDAKEHLDEARTALNLTIPTSTVGGSPVGKQLSHHSALADEALMKTIQGFEETIAAYRDRITTFVADMNEQDQSAAATGKRGESNVGTGSA